MELMPKELQNKLEKYPLYSQDELGGNAVVLVKYFNPIGGGTWLITDGEKLKDGDYLLSGYCHLGNDDSAEFGEVLLSELKNIKLPTGLTIERDLNLPENCDLVTAMKKSGIEPPDFILEDYRSNINDTINQEKDITNDLEDLEV